MWHSHQQCMGVLLCNFTDLVLAVFECNHSNECVPVFCCGFILYFFMINDIQHIFTYLIIHVSLMKHVIKIFVVKLGCFSCCTVYFKILDTSYLSDIFCKYFSLGMACIFTGKVLILVKSQFITLFSLDFDFYVLCKNIFFWSNPCSKSVPIHYLLSFYIYPFQVNY